jgi:hypothetical protein
MFTLSERYPMAHHRMNPENVSAMEGYLRSVFPPEMVEFKHVDAYYVQPEEFFGERYDIVGINAHFRGIQAVQEALTTWPLQDMATHVFVEGSYINSLRDGRRVIAQLLCSNVPEALIVFGEVEPAVEGLIESITHDRPIETVPNLLLPESDWEQRGETVVTDLSRITHQPYQYLCQLLDYPIHTYHVQTSRGCCYGNCAFCTDALIWGKGWRGYPIDNVINVFQDMSNEGVDYAFIFDKDFIGGNVVRAAELASALISIGNTVPYYAAFRATEIIKAEKLLPRLKESGLAFVFMGAETFSPAIAKRYAKGFTVNHSLQAIEILRAHQIDFRLGYIIDPLSSLEELLESLEVIDRSQLWGHLGNIFNRMAIRTGTRYEELGREAGILGHLDEENLTYEYTYLDPRVGKTMEICTRWLKDVPHINLYLLVGKRVTGVHGGNPDEFALFNRYLCLLNRLDCTTLWSVSKAVQKGAEQDISKVITSSTETYQALARRLARKLNPEYKASRAVLAELEYNNYL